MKTREEKDQIIEDLTQQLNDFSHVYLADISNLNSEDTTALRQKCFDREVKLMVVKNTLLKKAMEKADVTFDEVYDQLNGPMSVMLCNTANVPAKLIKEFRKDRDKPFLWAAYVEESFYIGDEQVENLAKLKSKEEIIGDVISMLQAPAQNVISGLKSGGGKLAGILETLAERSE